MIPFPLPASGAQITVSTVAKTVLDFIRVAASDAGWMPPKGANSFLLQAETGSLRYSGSLTPTVSTGIKITAGNSAAFDLTELDKIEIIRHDAVDCVVNISLYGYNIRLS